MQSSQLNSCLFCQLGTVSFPEAMEFEHSLIKLRFEDKISDTLLVFEHPPTVTQGKFGNITNVLLPPEELAKRGIAYYDSDRGGDATFNCPGQLVVHPIMDIRKRTGILRGYITDLEELALRVLKRHGVVAERWSQHAGIWVNGKQIGAVGLRISRGITMHGFSLNINPDLENFKVINLCGLAGKVATSIASELGEDVSVTDTYRFIQEEFATLFNVVFQPKSKDELKDICFGIQTCNPG